MEDLGVTFTGFEASEVDLHPYQDLYFLDLYVDGKPETYEFEDLNNFLDAITLLKTSGLFLFKNESCK